MSAGQHKKLRPVWLWKRNEKAGNLLKIIAASAAISVDDQKIRNHPQRAGGFWFSKMSVSLWQGSRISTDL